MPFPFMAAAVLGAGAMAGGASYYGQRKANKAMQGSAREQMAFQERMSNTAHQRSFADLRKAGINPMYYTGGATTPGGAGYSAGSEAGSGVSSALEVQRLSAEVENLETQNAVAKQQMKQANDMFDFNKQKLLWDTNSAKNLSALYGSMNVGATTDNLLKFYDSELARMHLNSARKSYDVDMSKFGDFMRYADRMAPLVSTARDFASIFKKGSVLNFNGNYGKK